jgi:CheY-like chemotaxis protein
MDGYQTIAHVRREQTLATTLIVALTSNVFRRLSAVAA